MSPSPNSSLVQRTINLNYTNKKRSDSLKWILLNAFLLLVFVYDLSCKCPGYTSNLHYVELACAVVFAANLVHYALSLLPTRIAPVSLSREQQLLLGLSDADLDSSFVLSNGNKSVSQRSESPTKEWSVSDAELSLSPRVWRSASAHSRSATPPSPPSPHSPHSPHSPTSATRSFDANQDRFIADSQTLAAYLKRRTELDEAESQAVGPGAGATWATPPPPYRLAAAAPAHKPEEHAPPGPAWWRLDLDPQRLTQWNLNLRLWLHETILVRLVRELAAADAALARAGAGEAGWLRAGRVPPARLRAHAAHLPALRPLLPFLEPFPDQTYLVRRITELAAGGCMSAYKWDGGGTGWTSSHPTDADLLLHLFATYLDSQASPTAYLDSQMPLGSVSRPTGESPGASGGVAGGGATGVWAGGADGPAIVRVRARPPQFALALGGTTLAVGGGRNNLLHALLLFVAAAARQEPPAVRRTHLGPAGLNMLWIIGR